MSDKKPTLADLGLDAPAPPPTTKKTWQQIADQVEEHPYRPTPASSAAPDSTSWNGIAAVMSFLIPGLGQLYKGHVVSGLFLFVVTLLCYGLFIFLGIVPHIVAIVDAGSRVK